MGCQKSYEQFKICCLVTGLKGRRVRGSCSGNTPSIESNVGILRFIICYGQGQNANREKMEAVSLKETVERERNDADGGQ